MSDKCKTFVARWDHAMCSTCGEEHAPTPTPAPGLDLDAVEQAIDASERAQPGYGVPAVVMPAPTVRALIAEVRALRAKLAEAKRLGMAACGIMNGSEHRRHRRGPGGAVTAAPLLVGCALHDGADIDACGCPALDSPGAIAYRGLLVKARAEIARLTAERDQAVAHRAATNEEIRRLHAVIKVKGFSVEDSIALHETRSEVARLTAELAAARAVPGDVEAAIEELRRAEEVDARAMTGQSLAARVLAEATLRTAIARAISDATAARGTVGGLLATAPVGSIVEWRSSTGRGWWQLRVRIDGNGVECRTCADGWPWGGWRAGQLLAGDMPRSARLVSAAEADADPNQRGPLPKGG